MKILKSKKMKELLMYALTRAKRFPKVKSPDYCYCLFDIDLKNGWHYQANKEYKRTSVYAFKPPRTYFAKSADYILTQEL